MSEGRIASLFERAAAGDRPMDIVDSGGRARWLRTIDFTRPTKFTPDQESRLRRAHESFCRVASTRLAMSAALLAEPIGSKLLLTLDVPLLLGSIERLLGSPSEAQPTQRPLT